LRSVSTQLWALPSTWDIATDALSAFRGISDHYATNVSREGVYFQRGQGANSAVHRGQRSHSTCGHGSQASRWQWQGVIYYLLIASQLPKYRICSFDSGSDTAHSNGTHASHLFRAIIKAPEHRGLLHLHAFCLTRRYIGSVISVISVISGSSGSSTLVNTESVVISLRGENP